MRNKRHYQFKFEVKDLMAPAPVVNVAIIGGIVACLIPCIVNAVSRYFISRGWLNNNI